MRSSKDLFMDKVLKPGSDCWIWTGCMMRDGYGKVGVNGETMLAHRYSWLLFRGELPADRPHLDHLCRVRCCVNPDHLEPVTHVENKKRAQAKFCGRGHPLAAPNLYEYFRNGKYVRRCKTCLLADRERVKAARRKACN
jgi:hypothetical protein